MTCEKQAQKFHTEDVSLPRSWYCFLLVVPHGKFDSANQKHYPDLGSDASSVWNLCTRFSDVIWQGNQYTVVLPNVSCFLKRLPIECRTQWLTRIDFQISFNPDWQIDDGFLKGCRKLDNSIGFLMFILSRAANLWRRLFLSEWQRSRYSTCYCEIEYVCYFSVSNIVLANQLMFIQGVP